MKIEEKELEEGRILTLLQLIDAGACSEQVELFKKMFGTEVKVTQTLCLKVVSKFDWRFAGYRLLCGSARLAFIKVHTNSFLEGAETYIKTLAIAFAKGYNSNKDIF